MTKVKNTAGIDISKLFFDVCLLDTEGKNELKRFSNDTEGIRQAAQWMGTGVLCVMEATGPYYLRLAVYLHSQSFYVSVVNPLVIKRFSQMRLIRTKTDKADARMIALYGCSEELALWNPPTLWSVTLQQLSAVGDQLQKHRCALCAQLDGFTQSGMMDKQTQRFLKIEIRRVENKEAALQKTMDDLIMLYHQQMIQQLTSIPGLGKKTALALIVITGGFKRFKNYRQLSAYLGICPRVFESGTSIKGKARICKMGMSRIRALLYVCSWSACRYNKACKELYERLLQKGKPKKLALIAVANKLIKQAFAIATQHVFYDPDYQKNICF
jgi:transposase